MYAALVEALLVASGVGEMGGIVGCKVMVAGEIALGAHVQVIVHGGVEHGVDGALGGDAYGAGRKAGDAIGVVGRGGVEHVAGYAPEAPLTAGEFDRGIGLELHASLKAVDVQATDFAKFIGLGRFFLDYGRYDRHLLGGEAEGVGLGHAVLIPPFVAVIEEALHNLGGRGGPVEFVGVGEECSHVCIFGETLGGEDGVAGGEELLGGAFGVAGHGAGPVGEGASVVPRYFYGGLAAGLKAPGCADGEVAVVYEVCAAGIGGRAALEAPEHHDAVGLGVAELHGEGVVDGVGAAAGGDIYPCRRAAVALQAEKGEDAEDAHDAERGFERRRVDVFLG